MEQSPYWQTNRVSASQEITHFMEHKLYIYKAKI